jgi:hypothetical protein
MHKVFGWNINMENGHGERGGGCEVTDDLRSDIAASSQVWIVYQGDLSGGVYGGGRLHRKSGTCHMNPNKPLLLSTLFTWKGEGCFLQPSPNLYVTSLRTGYCAAAIAL